jgi:hypothetical protein
LITNYKQIFHFSFHSDLSNVFLIYFVSHFPLCSLFPNLFPLSLSIHRASPLPIPIYVCCHGYSLHKGLTSCMRYTHAAENISPLMRYGMRRQSQYLSWNTDDTLPISGVGFMNSPMEVHICAWHLYVPLPFLVLGETRTLSSNLR